MSRTWVGFIVEDPISLQDQDHQDAISKVFAGGWGDSDGFVIPPEKEPGTFLLDDASTYGEITELGSRQVFYHMRLDERSQDISFLDMGSGVGRLVVQAYMELPGLVSSTGIELSLTRSDLAKKSWEHVQEDANIVRAMKKEFVKNATLELFQGDLFDMDLSKVTNVFVSSLCFSDTMMEKLGEKIISERNNIQRVATIRKFPPKYESQLGKPEAFFIEMSWTQPRGAQVYFYSPKR